MRAARPSRAQVAPKALFGGLFGGGSKSANDGAAAAPAVYICVDCGCVRLRVCMCDAVGKRLLFTLALWRGTHTCLQQRLPRASAPTQLDLRQGRLQEGARQLPVPGLQLAQVALQGVQGQEPQG